MNPPSSSSSDVVHRQLSRLSSLRRLSFSSTASLSLHDDDDDDTQRSNSGLAQDSAFSYGMVCKNESSSLGEDGGDSLLCWSSGAAARRDSPQLSMTSVDSTTANIQLMRPHLCSGTVNGRGSFLSENILKRQQRYASCDSLERVLQDPLRIRKLFIFLKERAQSCLSFGPCRAVSELLLEATEAARLYDEIVGDHEGCSHSYIYSDGCDAPSKHAGRVARAGEEGNGNSNKRLADLVSCFSIEVEEQLREEIIERYVRKNAPIQVCMPSEIREQIMSRSRIAHELPKNKRLSIFREAQRFCYGELQQNLMAAFFQREPQIVLPCIMDMENSTTASEVLSVGWGCALDLDPSYRNKSDQYAEESRTQTDRKPKWQSGADSRHSPGLASMNSSLFAAEVFGEAGNRRIR